MRCAICKRHIEYPRSNVVSAQPIWGNARPARRFILGSTGADAVSRRTRAAVSSSATGRQEMK